MKRVLLIFLSSVALAGLVYLYYALLHESGAQKRLRREEAYYATLVPQLESRVRVLEEEVEELRRQDDSLYRSIFKAPAPQADPVSSLDFLFGNDTIPNRLLARYTRDKADRLLERCAGVDATLREITVLVREEGFAVPPIRLPLDTLHTSQFGASVGEKYSPVYSKEMRHGGLDLIALRGTPVRATADGSVRAAARLRSGPGHVVEIAHPGGYLTRYAHLDDIFVAKGQRIRRGQVIGTLGMSGAAFAPHLHYEVRRDGRCLDPVHFFFLDMTPWNYANVLFVTTNTGQSLD